VKFAHCKIILDYIKWKRALYEAITNGHFVPVPIIPTSVYYDRNHDLTRFDPYLECAIALGRYAIALRSEHSSGERDQSHTRKYDENDASNLRNDLIVHTIHFLRLMRRIFNEIVSKSALRQSK
jgi:hypothetical protein